MLEHRHQWGDGGGLHRWWNHGIKGVMVVVGMGSLGACSLSIFLSDFPNFIESLYLSVRTGKSSCAKE